MYMIIPLLRLLRLLRLLPLFVPFHLLGTLLAVTGSVHLFPGLLVNWPPSFPSPAHVAPHPKSRPPGVFPDPNIHSLGRHCEPNPYARLQLWPLLSLQPYSSFEPLNLDYSDKLALLSNHSNLCSPCSLTVLIFPTSPNNTFYDLAYFFNLTNLYYPGTLLAFQTSVIFNILATLLTIQPLQPLLSWQYYSSFQPLQPILSDNLAHLSNLLNLYYPGNLTHLTNLSNLYCTIFTLFLNYPTIPTFTFLAIVLRFQPLCGQICLPF